MHHATSRSFKLAIAPGVPSSRLSTLLALQRAEEPDIAITFFEVAGDDLAVGLQEGRYDAGMSLQDTSAPSLSSQPLWCENMAVAVPPRFPLPNQAMLTVAELLSYPVFRWQAEACPCWINGCLPWRRRWISRAFSTSLRSSCWPYGSRLATVLASLRNRASSAPMSGGLR